MVVRNILQNHNLMRYSICNSRFVVITVVISQIMYVMLHMESGRITICVMCYHDMTLNYIFGVVRYGVGRRG